MGEHTAISWTHHTFNPWVGCSKISPACEHCYAESWAKRAGFPGLWSDGERRRTSASNWNQPLKWNRAAAEAGTRARVFCASLADVFDNVVPDEWRVDLFRLIRSTPNLDWLLLTKRIGNASAVINRALTDGHLFTSREPFWPWPNVWLGATIANQEEADRDIPKLVSIPAKVRFLSCEPLLGPIDLPLGHVMTGFPRHITRDGRAVGAPLAIHWVITGGESGHHARPTHPNWIRSLREQCVGAGVAFHHKQWGAFLPSDQPEARNLSYDERSCHDWGDGIDSIHMRPKESGRMVDGRIWDQFPTVPA